MNKEKLWTKAIGRFWKFVDKRGPDDCWEWQGVKDKKGYGKFTIGVNRIRAHRFSWIMHFGPIPEGEGYHGTCVLHRCDNPPCVNPRHILLGTQHENMTDAMSKGRRPTKKPRIKLGYPKGADARRFTRLTPSQVKEMKQLLALPSRPSLYKIARQFGVSYNTAWSIANNKSWIDI